MLFKMKNIVILFVVGVVLTLGSCTKEIETPAFDQVQGRWQLDDFFVEEIIDGEVVHSIDRSYDLNMSLSEEGRFQTSDTLGLYLFALEENEFGGTYFVSHNETKIHFSKGMFGLASRPEELHDVIELSNDKFIHEMLYVDSLINYIDKNEVVHEDYVNVILAAFMGQADGEYRGGNIDLNDYEQGYENGYDVGYGAIYAIFDQEKSYYREFLRNMAALYAIALKESGVDITGSSYEQGYLAGEAAGGQAGLLDGQNAVHKKCDELRVTYSSKR